MCNKILLIIMKACYHCYVHACLVINIKVKVWHNLLSLKFVKLVSLGTLGHKNTNVKYKILEIMYVLRPYKIILNAFYLGNLFKN
jgi:hypothetical protein